MYKIATCFVIKFKILTIAYLLFNAIIGNFEHNITILIMFKINEDILLLFVMHLINKLIHQSISYIYYLFFVVLI